MRLTRCVPVIAFGCAAALSACGATVGSPTVSSSAASSTALPVATSAPASTPQGSQTAVPTALDPCQLVTAQEAAALAGASFGTGEESTTQGGGKICTYGAETTDVFDVIVAQASDPATAQADWSQEEAQVQSDLQQAVQSAQAAGVALNFNVNDVSNVSGADRAAVGTISGTISGVVLSGSAIYLLKGSDFVAFSDLAVGHASPSTSAMEAQASTTLGRV